MIDFDFKSTRLNCEANKHLDKTTFGSFAHHENKLSVYLSWFGFSLNKESGIIGFRKSNESRNRKRERRLLLAFQLPLLFFMCLEKYWLYDFLTMCNVSINELHFECRYYMIACRPFHFLLSFSADLYMLLCGVLFSRPHNSCSSTDYFRLSPWNRAITGHLCYYFCTWFIIFIIIFIIVAEQYTYTYAFLFYHFNAFAEQLFLRPKPKSDKWKQFQYEA